MWNGAFDGLYGPGDQWYWRGDFAREIPDEAVAVHAEFGERLPSWKSTMHLYSVDGAVQDVGPDETAFAYRDVTYSTVIAGVDPGRRHRCRRCGTGASTTGRPSTRTRPAVPT